MPKSYQPGQRDKKYGHDAKITENRWAWAQVEIGKFLILVGNDEGHGPDVVLYLPRPGRQAISLSLTTLTEQELDALKDLIDSAFEWARPVVIQRDKEAQDAWDNGDDSHSRSYRAVPQLVYRKRPVSEHGEGVLQRSQGVPEGGGGGRADHEGGVRGAGDELAEPDSERGESEDDCTQVD